MRCLLIAALVAAPLHAAAPPVKPKKIVLIAGKKSHGPEGNGVHDYGWSVRLIRAMLARSNAAQAVRVEAHLGGWPRDPELADADAVLVVSDGRDGTRYEEAPHLATPERVRAFDRLMRRGCGLMTFHFSTFAPERHRAEVLRWNGGYFQWEQGGKRAWYSAIRTLEADVAVDPAHPVARGVKPFRLREEFYYNLRMSADAAAVASVADLKGRAPDGNVVAWALQRDAGRGFGTTCGHFYDNWQNPMFRKLMLNGLVWSAGAEVPAGGVEAAFLTHDEIARADRPTRVLLFAGNEAHRWHNWEKTTPRIRAALEQDGRTGVDVSLDIEDLSRRRLSDYGAVVLNYCNWHDGRPLSEASRAALVAYLGEGGGLISVHFANGAFHRSLPLAGASDWPEYRRIVRRVWDHGAKPTSGHDAFGRFVVRPADAAHPITAGLKPFEVTDELYFRQAGEEPVGEPLIAAESKVTGKLEPLAWAYRYGKGRVFQTLLGHSEKTYDAPEAGEMLRRAAAWVAKGAKVEVRFPGRDGPPFAATSFEAKLGAPDAP
ncbi:MAG: ThuA domain-containing protein [Gemmataceae bacterium]